MSTAPCPRKSTREHLQGNRSEAAMTPTTTAIRSCVKRDTSEVFCKKRVTMPTKAQLTSLSVGTPQSSGAPCVRRGHTQIISARLSRAHTHQPSTSAPPVSAFCQGISPLLQKLVRLPSWHVHRYRPSKRESYCYWSTATAHPI